MSLVTIRPGVTFRDAAAASFQRIEAQLGRPADVNRTTDSWDTQMEKYRAYQAYQAGGPWAPLALHPKYSRHVYKPDDALSGTAWDTDERGAWLDQHGWVANVPEEPWHREHRAWLDQHINDRINPTPDTLKEITEMFIAVVNGNWHLVIPQGNAKPRAALLGGESKAAEAGVPIFYFTDPNAVLGIKTAVDGIFG